MRPGMRVGTCYGLASVCDVDPTFKKVQVSLWHQGGVYWADVSDVWEPVR